MSMLGFPNGGGMVHELEFAHGREGTRVLHDGTISGRLVQVRISTLGFISLGFFIIWIPFPKVCS